MAQTVTVETTVHAPASIVWAAWTDPKHIVKWNFASDDWECPKASNDVKTGGKFSATMAAKDKSFSFDFGGTYARVTPGVLLAYTMDDGRRVTVRFVNLGSRGVKVVETFDIESTHPKQFQRKGWQAILQNFKKHAESLS